MKRILIMYMFLCCLCLSGVGGQVIAFNSGDMLDKIANKARTGDKTALRDMGSLIDNPLYQSRVKALLMQLTTFEEDGLVWAKVNNKIDFYNYYYPRQEKIHYDELMALYMVTPPEKLVLLPYREEEQYITTNVLSEKAQLGYEHAMKGLKSLQSETFLDGLGLLSELPEKHERMMLQKLAENTKLLAQAKWTGEKSAFALVLESLVNVADSSSLTLASSWLQLGYLTAAEVEIPLSKLTNRYIGTVEAQTMLRQVSALKDSLFTFDEIRQSGFRQLYSVQPSFFEEEVDYYGWLVVKASNDPWALHNAVAMMIQTHHPRVLYYLAALVNRNRGLYPIDPTTGLIKIPYLAQIEKLTNMRLYISDSGKHLERQSNEWFWLMQYAAYWAQHWHEYEWDVDRGIFVNILKSKTREQQVDFHFRQLLSSNDSLAALSYREITQFDPAAVKDLVEGYQAKLRGINASLPSFKKDYLVQTTRFVQWCRVQKMDLALPKKLKDMTVLLSSELTPMARHQLEQQILQTATLANVEGLEYEALLMGDHLPESFSYSRILDKLYDKFLPQIIQQKQLMRLYLKKSAIFEQIRTIGTCNAYLKKLPYNQAPFKMMLENIHQVETDKDILAQLEHIGLRTKAVAAVGAGANTLAVQKLNVKPLSMQELWETRKNGSTDRQQRALAIFELMNTPSMLEVLASSQTETSPYKDSIFTLLTQWFAGDYEFSEYEEQGLVYILVLLHPTKNTVQHRLENLQSFRLNDLSKANIRRKLLAPINYDALKTVLPSIDRWGSDEQGNLISTLVLSDFGLPPIDFENTKDKEELIKWAASNDLPALIELYFQKMGVVLRNSAKKLDFDAVNDILQSEIIMPYTGGGGKYRDYLVYGTIKILEKQFNTTLGFHEKLNENQTFFTINASARAQAWHTYLVEQKLLTRERLFPSWE